MRVEEIKKLINLPTTRVVESNTPVKDSNGLLIKYSLYDASNKLLLSAVGKHGNAFIPKTEQGVWSIYDGNGQKIDISWADFTDVFGMLGIKYKVQKEVLEKNMVR